MITREEVGKIFDYLLHVERFSSEPVPLFLDALLDAMPDLIEDRKILSTPVAVIRSYGHLDECPSLTRSSEDDAARRAQIQLDRKRMEFSRVEMAFEQLRDAIRTYCREVRI